MSLKINKHSEPLFQKSNFSLPGVINFSNFFITPPKDTSNVFRSRRQRNSDFVSFVTILPTFAAKRPDYQQRTVTQKYKKKLVLRFYNFFHIMQ